MNILMEVIIIICIYCKIMNLMQMRLQRLFVIAFRILFQSLKQKYHNTIIYQLKPVINLLNT